MHSIEKELKDRAEFMANISADFEEPLTAIIRRMLAIFRNGNKLLVMGNGGSSSQASHFVGELVGRLYRNRSPIPAIDMSSNSAVVTCIANDYGYEDIFSRQIDALADAGDCIVAFSTSGNSENIVSGLKMGKDKGNLCVGFLGSTGGAAIRYCDHACLVPELKTTIIQEVHLSLIHVMCEFIENELFDQVTE